MLRFPQEGNAADHDPSCSVPEGIMALSSTNNSPPACVRRSDLSAWQDGMHGFARSELLK